MFILKLSPDESKIRIFTGGGMECIGYITDTELNINRAVTLTHVELRRLSNEVEDYEAVVEFLKQNGRLSM